MSLVEFFSDYFGSGTRRRPNKPAGIRRTRSLLRDIEEFMASEPHRRWSGQPKGLNGLFELVLWLEYEVTKLAERQPPPLLSRPEDDSPDEPGVDEVTSEFVAGPSAPNERRSRQSRDRRRGPEPEPEPEPEPAHGETILTVTHQRAQLEKRCWQLGAQIRAGQQELATVQANHAATIRNMRESFDKALKEREEANEGFRSRLNEEKRMRKEEVSGEREARRQQLEQQRLANEQRVQSLHASHEQNMQTLGASHRQKLDELEGRYKREMAQFEASLEALEQTRQRQLREQDDKFRKKVDDQAERDRHERSTLTEQLNSIGRRHETQMNQLSATHQAQKDANDKEHNFEMEKLKVSHQKETEAMIQDHRQQLRELENQIEHRRKAADQWKRYHDEEMERQAQDHEDQVVSKAEEHQKEQQAMVAEHSRQLGELQEKARKWERKFAEQAAEWERYHRGEMTRQTEDHESQLATKERERREQLEEASSELDRTLQAHCQELEQLKAQHADEIARLVQRLDEARIQTDQKIAVVNRKMDQQKRVYDDAVDGLRMEHKTLMGKQEAFFRNTLKKLQAKHETERANAEEQEKLNLQDIRAENVKLKSDLLSNRRRNQAWTDQQLKIKFRDLKQLVDDTMSPHRLAISNNAILDATAHIDQTDFLYRRGVENGHFLIKSAVWAILINQFFSVPFGFGAFGSRGEKQTLLGVYLQWKDVVYGTSISEDECANGDIFVRGLDANNFRSALFQTVVAPVEGAADSANPSLVNPTAISAYQLQKECIQEATGRIMDLLSRVASSSVTSSLRDFVANISRMALELALQFGVHPAELKLLNPVQYDKLKVGSQCHDCLEEDTRRGELLTVDLVVSPGICRIGDGRKDSNTEVVIVPCDVFPESRASASAR